MGFLDNLLCKETLERNALLENRNIKLMQQNAELKAEVAKQAQHVASIDVFNKTLDQYRHASAALVQKATTEKAEYEEKKLKLELVIKNLEDNAAHLENKLRIYNAELISITEKSDSYNALIEKNRLEEKRIEKNLADLIAENQRISAEIENNKDIESISKTEANNAIHLMESLKEQKLIAEKVLQTVTTSLDLTQKAHENEIVFDIMEMDCKAGYVTEWAPQIFKRLFRHDHERAKSLFLELWARHPEPEKFMFSEDSLILRVDGKPVEELFAAIVSEKTGQNREDSEQFIQVWEKFVNAGN